MTTISELDTFSDAELTERIAVEVLGWTLTGTRSVGEPLGIPPEGVQYPEIAQTLPAILTDWNETRKILDRIGTLGLAGTCTANLMNLLDVDFAESAQVAAHAILYADQRGICEAALLSLPRI